MNITEANAVSSVIDWLVDIEAPAKPQPRGATDLVWLAGRANKALGAGYTAAEADAALERIMEHRATACADRYDGEAARAVCWELQRWLAGGTAPLLPPSLIAAWDDWASLQDGCSADLSNDPEGGE